VGGKVHRLIEGGIVITMDAERRIYEPGYVAIQGGKIVGTGSSAACPCFGKERLDASDTVMLLKFRENRRGRKEAN
jgi:cytosine/adenosine deaminase-related metal-dependent hydrolase